MKLRLDMTCRERKLLEDLLEGFVREEDEPVARRIRSKIRSAWQNAATKSNTRS